MSSNHQLKVCAASGTSHVYSFIDCNRNDLVLTLSSSCCCRRASYSIAGWDSWVKVVLVSCSHGHSSSYVSQNWQAREWALSSCRQRSEFSWLTTLYFSDKAWSFTCMRPQWFDLYVTQLRLPFFINVLIFTLNACFSASSLLFIMASPVFTMSSTASLCLIMSMEKLWRRKRALDNVRFIMYMLEMTTQMPDWPSEPVAELWSAPAQAWHLQGTTTSSPPPSATPAPRQPPDQTAHQRKSKQTVICDCPYHISKHF